MAGSAGSTAHTCLLPYGRAVWAGYPHPADWIGQHHRPRGQNLSAKGSTAHQHARFLM